MYKNAIEKFENSLESFKKELEQTDFNSKGLIIDGKFRKIQEILSIRKEWLKFSIVCKIEGKTDTYVECLEYFVDEKDYKQTILREKKKRMDTLKDYITKYTEELKQLEKEFEK